MKKTQIINKRGQVVAVIDEDSDAIVPDGFGIRVPMMLQDSVPTAGHKPGYIYDAGDNEAPARDAYADMKARTSNAWRTTSVATTDTSEDAREAYKARLSNAWRTGKAESATLPPAPRNWARPAPDAWGGPWVNQNPNPKPADVTMDAAPNSDAAWQAMVQRTENAWRAK